MFCPCENQNPDDSSLIEHKAVYPNWDGRQVLGIFWKVPVTVLNLRYRV